MKVSSALVPVAAAIAPVVAGYLMSLRGRRISGQDWRPAAGTVLAFFLGLLVPIHFAAGKWQAPAGVWLGLAAAGGWALAVMFQRPNVRRWVGWEEPPPASRKRKEAEPQ
jgi:MFS family permease